MDHLQRPLRLEDQPGGGNGGGALHHKKRREQQTREPEYSQKAASRGANDYGSTYVEINLTAQHLYFYKNGELLVETDFVSGNESRGWATPGGAYPLTYKQRNATLRGEGYATPVSYWMPFNGGIGLHDASWRGSFGGAIIRPAAPMAASTFRLRRLRRSLKTSPREIRCSATTWPVQSPKKRLRRKNRQQPCGLHSRFYGCTGDHSRTGTGADPAAGRAAGGSQRGASRGEYGWSGRRNVSGGIQSPGNSSVSGGNGSGCARPCGSVCDGRRG